MPRPKTSPGVIEQAKQMLRAGHSGREIIAELHTSTNLLARLRREMADAGEELPKPGSARLRVVGENEQPEPAVDAEADEMIGVNRDYLTTLEALRDMYVENRRLRRLLDEVQS